MKFDLIQKALVENTLENIKNSLNMNLAAIMLEYHNFEEKAQKSMIGAEDMLKVLFDNDPVQLEQSMENCVTHSYTIGQLVSDAQSFLIIFEVANFTAKDKTVSETDRKQKVEIKTVRQKNMLQRLKILEKALDKKISSNQSILKYETARYMREGK